jgi:fluoride exporter
MPGRRRKAGSETGPPPRRHLESDHEALPVDPDLAPEDPSEPAAGRLSGARVRRSRQLDVLAAIFLGGILGALARYEVELAWPARTGHVPWATFTINTSGAAFLAFTLTVLLEHPGRLRYLRPFLCVGFTGAWTTMSTFALESDLLVKHGQPGIAVLYVVATVVLGLLGTWVGIAAAQRVHQRGLAWPSR